MTRELNPGPRVRIPSALTTKPLSHTSSGRYLVTGSTAWSDELGVVTLTVDAAVLAAVAQTDK